MKIIKSLVLIAALVGVVAPCVALLTPSQELEIQKQSERQKRWQQLKYQRNQQWQRKRPKLQWQPWTHQWKRFEFMKLAIALNRYEDAARNNMDPEEHGVADGSVLCISAALNKTLSDISWFQVPSNRQQAAGLELLLNERINRTSKNIEKFHKENNDWKGIAEVLPLCGDAGKNFTDLHLLIQSQTLTKLSQMRARLCYTTSPENVALSQWPSINKPFVYSTDRSTWPLYNQRRFAQ